VAINNIVLQIKMLAHTARIEAARAGEQGMGFGAVAEEIRDLALSAATTAEEIKNLMNDSLNKVCDSKKWVTQASVTAEEIVKAMEDVTAMMSEMKKISATQSACINQTNQAIEKWTI
jgi:methyl-accepting chemotaxis protein